MFEAVRLGGGPRVLSAILLVKVYESHVMNYSGLPTGVLDHL